MGTDVEYPCLPCHTLSDSLTLNLFFNHHISIYKHPNEDKIKILIDEFYYFIFSVEKEVYW